MKHSLIVTVLAYMTVNSALMAGDVYRDKLTGKHMSICSEDKDTFYVAEACGKYWEKYPRKRDQLAKLLTEYKDVKKGDEVMLPVKKEGVMTWAIGTVSFIYEDGAISVMEYYTNPGPTGGTLTWTMDYKLIAQKNIGVLSTEKEVCVKEAFDIFYGPTNKRKYSFEKDEKLTVHQSYSNAMMTVSYQGFMKNFFSYGKDSKLPIEQSKVEICKPEQADSTVDDGKREKKQVIEDGQPTRDYIFKNLSK